MTDILKDDLALAHRAVAHFGWDDLTYTHLTARQPGAQDYYIGTFGKLFAQIQAQDLLHVDFSGAILSGPGTYNPTGHAIHHSIYRHRGDVNAIFHLHTPANVAISALECGLLPLSQWALHFYERIGYHDYDSLVLTPEKAEAKMVDDLGHHPVLILRNHGVVICGTTIAEAFYYAHHFEQACKTQLLIQATGQNAIGPQDTTCLEARKDLLSFEPNRGTRDWHAIKGLGI